MPAFPAGADQLLLDQRDLLERNLDAEVAPGHHDPVGGPQDFIDVLHSLTVFDLRNDPDRTLSGIEQFAHGRDIGRIPDERVCDVVELKLDRVRDKATVFPGQRLGIQLDVRHIDRFMVFKHAVMDRRAFEHFPLGGQESSSSTAPSSQTIRPAGATSAAKAG